MVASPPQGQFDRLEISANAELPGSIDVSVEGGFVPALGDQFEIVTYGSRSGALPSLTGFTPGPGLALGLIDSGTALSLESVAEP